MKNFLSYSVLCAFVCTSLIVAGPKTIKLIDTDKYKNEIRFFSEAPLEKVSGTAGNVSGAFTIDLNNLSSTAGLIVVPVNSMATGSSSRYRHMMDADWLNEPKFKTISYALKSLSVDNIESAVGARTVISATAKGDFMLHGVSNPVDAKVKITYLNESPQTKGIAAGDIVLIQAEFNVSLSAHKIYGKGGMVGSRVGDTITITATLFGSSASQQ